MNWWLTEEDVGEEEGGTDEMKGKVDNGWADRVKGMDKEAGKENVKDEGWQRERGRYTSQW